MVPDLSMMVSRLAFSRIWQETFHSESLVAYPAGMEWLASVLYQSVRTKKTTPLFSPGSMIMNQRTGFGRPCEFSREGQIGSKAISLVRQTMLVSISLRQTKNVSNIKAIYNHT